MDKLTYGSYSSDITDVVFDSTKGYSEPNGEQEVRKQLSFPLKEVKDYINSIANTDSEGTTILLRISADDLIQYSLDGETWNDTASGGHILYDEEGNALPQRTRLMFNNTNIYDTGDMTIVEGIQGEEGVGVSSIVQVSSSPDSGGQNVWRATLTNGSTYDFIVLNGQQGEQGEMGTGLIILGTYATLEDLQIAHPVGNKGDCYIVGTADSNPAYIWDMDNQAWEYIGKIRGEKGATGDTGAQGVSIQSVVETTHSSVSGGENIWTVTLSNGNSYNFSVYNGTQGEAGTGMPTGGTAGQLLAKLTSADYSLTWVNPASADQTYDATSTNAQSGVAVAEGISDAIADLDGTVSGTPSASKTLTAFSETDGVVDATFSDIEITKSQVSDFDHAHGNITSGGDITTNVAIASGDRLVINDESASKVNNSSITFGTSTDTFLSNKGTWVHAIPKANTGNVLMTVNGASDLRYPSSGNSTVDVWVAYCGYLPKVNNVALTPAGASQIQSGFFLLRAGQYVTLTHYSSWNQWAKVFGVTY